VISCTPKIVVMMSCSRNPQQVHVWSYSLRYPLPRQIPSFGKLPEQLGLGAGSSCDVNCADRRHLVQANVLSVMSPLGQPRKRRANAGYIRIRAVSVNYISFARCCLERALSLSNTILGPEINVGEAGSVLKNWPFVRHFYGRPAGRRRASGGSARFTPVRLSCLCGAHNASPPPRARERQAFVGSARPNIKSRRPWRA
jgi:hypothetical protein